jgi:hypothetical protein
MSGSSCGAAARVLVTVTAPASAAINRHCPRCDRRRRFVSSGKFRLNAQKKRIDAWLIFRCAACDARWNWPIHERQPLAALAPAELDALVRNDPALAADHAAAAIARSGDASESDAADARCFRRKLIHPAGEKTGRIEVVFGIEGRGPRLDRLLAFALSISRAEVHELGGAGIGKALRRAAFDGQRIEIELTACDQALSARLRQALRGDG